MCLGHYPPASGPLGRSELPLTRWCSRLTSWQLKPFGLLSEKRQKLGAEAAF